MSCAPGILLTGGQKRGYGHMCPYPRFCPPVILLATVTNQRRMGEVISVLQQMRDINIMMGQRRRRWTNRKPYSAVIDFSHQILTSKVDPCTEK